MYTYYFQFLKKYGIVYGLFEYGARVHVSDMNENEKDTSVLHQVMVYEDKDGEDMSETECRFRIDH